MEKVYTSIEFNVGNVVLNVSVTEDLKPRGGNLKNFGYIQIESSNKTGVFWDNLSYFFDLTPDKKAEIKEELTEKGEYYPGVIKDIKKVIKRALKLGFLIKNE